MRWAKLSLAALFAVTAHAQVAVVNFQGVVTRNCVFIAKSAVIQHKYKPQEDRLATLKGAALKAFALKIQKQIDAEYTVLFNKQSADVATFQRTWAKEQNYRLLLDSSVTDKAGRPLAVMYVDREKDTGIDVTEALLKAYNEKNGCQAPDLPASDHHSVVDIH